MQNDNYTSLKDLLRQKRLLLDLNLEEVEEKTSIKAKNLRALENGNFYELPASVYVQGYLKSLCKLYSLEYAKVLSLYETDLGLVSGKIEPERLQPQALSSPYPTVTPKALTTIALSVAFLVIAGYMAGQISHVTSAPSISLEAPAEGTKLTHGFVDVTGSTEPGSALTINNQAVPVEPDGKFKQTLYLNLGENQIVIRSANRFGNFSEVQRRIVVAEPPQVLGEQTSAAEE